MTTTSSHNRPLVLAGRMPDLFGALCDRIQGLQQDDPLRPVTVIVGSSLQRAQLADAVVKRVGAVANVTFVTLGRFAETCAAHHGDLPAQVSLAVRERIVRSALQHTHLQHYAPVAGRPHFAQALAATFADLRQALVDPAAGWARLAEPGGAGPGGSPRVADLTDLYARYCGELERRGLCDDAAVLLRATAAVSRRADASGTVVFGLYDLNGAQEQLISALCRHGADLLVPVPAGSEQVGAGILSLAAPGEAAPTLPSARPVCDSERFAAAWCSAGSAGLALQGDGTLTVLSVPDERSEAREAVRMVLAAAGGGVPAWDCAVVVPHVADAGRVAAALSDAGLPAAGRLPGQTEGARLVLRLLDCLAPRAGRPFGRRAVLDLLGAAPLPSIDVRPEDRAQWLAEARAAGILGGLDEWTDRLARRRRGLAAGAPAVADVDDDNGPLPNLASQRRQAALRTLDEALVRLAGECRRLPARAGWQEWSELLAACIHGVFGPQPANAARDELGILHELGVLAEQVELADVAAALHDHLGKSRIAEGRVGRSGVAVLTPIELRGLNFAVVVFTGLAEGGFPSVGRADPVLDDPARRRIGAALGTRLPLAENRAEESTLLFGLACQAAREQLVLISPRTDAATGRSRLPSRLLLHAASLAAGRSVGLDEFLSGDPLRPVWRHIAGVPEFTQDDSGTWLHERERDAAVLLALSEGGPRTATEEYLSAVLSGATSARRRLDCAEASLSPVPGRWDGLLGERARLVLADRHPLAGDIPPTRLERYVGCPFVFFLRDVLGLSVPQEPAASLEMERSEFGLLVHEILRRAYERLMEGWDRSAGPDAAAAREAVVAAWTECCARAEQRGVTGAPLAWEVRRKVLLEDLLEAVGRDPVFRGDGRPVSVEWGFGAVEGRPVSLEISAGRQVSFAGRIDRIDQSSAGLRIVDYKTGRGDSERKRLRKGLGVQLPVYQMAAQTLAGAESVRVSAVYRMVTRRGGFEDIGAPDLTVGRRQVRNLASTALGLIDRGLFPRSSETECEYCDTKYACGATAWARARKREHERVHDVVELQRCGPPSSERDDD